MLDDGTGVVARHFSLPCLFFLFACVAAGRPVVTPALPGSEPHGELRPLLLPFAFDANPEPSLLGHAVFAFPVAVGLHELLGTLEVAAGLDLVA